MFSLLFKMGPYQSDSTTFRQKCNGDNGLQKLEKADNYESIFLGWMIRWKYIFGYLTLCLSR